MTATKFALHADFHISYECNRKCLFCSESDRMEESRVGFIPVDVVAKKLEELRGRGMNSVLFTGGEPFLHPGLREIVEAAKGLDYYIGISSHGMSVDPEFYSEIAEKVNLLQLSFHAHESELFEKIVGTPGGFEKLETLINSIRKYVGKTFFMANVVMTRENSAYVLETIKKICSYETFKMILLSNLAPEGRGLRNYKELALSLTEVAEIVDNVKHYMWRGNVETHVFGVPFCALGRHGANSNDIFFRPKYTIELDAGASGEGNAQLKETYSADCTRERVKPEACVKCSCNDDNFCGGVFKEYVKHFGTDELKPIQPERFRAAAK